MAYSVLIGGDRSSGGAGSYPIVNPATEQVVDEAPQASVEQVDAPATSSATTWTS